MLNVGKSSSSSSVSISKSGEKSMSVFSVPSLHENDCLPLRSLGNLFILCADESAEKTTTRICKLQNPVFPNTKENCWRRSSFSLELELYFSKPVCTTKAK